MKIIVLGVETIEYATRAGDTVHRENIYYFDPSERFDDSMEKGYRLLKKDIFPKFSRNDFPELPGVYEMKFRPVRNTRSGKMEPNLVAINFLQKVNFNPNAENYLLFGCKRYKFRGDNGKGKLVRGVKFYGIDPLGYMAENDFLGFPVLEASVDTALDTFQGFPGYYDLDLEQIRGNQGDSLYKANDARFIAPYVFEKIEAAA